VTLAGALRKRLATLQYRIEPFAIASFIPGRSGLSSTMPVASKTNLDWTWCCPDLAVNPSPSRFNSVICALISVTP
jgi:hypothetical protein